MMPKFHIALVPPLAVAATALPAASSPPLPERPDLWPSEAEVERILHVPLTELLLPEVWREEIWTRAGFTRPITFFELHGDTVWGATGAMLRQLLAIVTGTDDTIVREV